ncbi:hypothetical protein [Streptomyces sp. NBC_01190]|uniref:hypothetical protein n=1 Tax=Streptomyces sp. NBC_01190 TaxID=2903767 RepID=UPI00386D09C6|nr:hypothetical protein OG519_15905 [Streptomyces sp. NBC_01190]
MPDDVPERETEISLGAAAGAGRPSDPNNPADLSQPDDGGPERRRKRAAFLRELNEAKELRDRVQPRRARAARMRRQMRMRTFRW